MKNIAKASLLTFVIVLTIGCGKDEQPRTMCDSENRVTVNNRAGRIYKWTTSEPNFFYIGNITQVSNGINGGYIPCNGLPLEFQKEGLNITYSGIDKGSFPDTNDPQFAHIRLTNIKEYK